MNKTIATKILSVAISLAMLATSFPVSAGAIGPVGAPAVPDFVKALTPPARLGYVDSYYQGQTAKPVILIEDLHANYCVQRKIEGLLQYFQPILTAGGHPMVLGIEGAWGPLNLTRVRSVALKVRQAAADFLLKEAEISGMEHFAALSREPILFYGIENPEDYLLHRELFRKSLAARLELANKIDKLREAINLAKLDGSSNLRHLWKLADDFHAGRIDLQELSQVLKMPLSDYGQAEAALARTQSVAASTVKSDKAFYMKNVVAADQDLELLSRLFRQQLTMEEVQYVASRIPHMLRVIQSLIPGENLQLWKDTVRSAIDHYAVAIVRNQPMAAHAKELVSQNPNESVVIVTGGFHTAGIAADFKSKKISYVVVAPIVESQTPRDERLYLKRMMGLHVTNPQIVKAAREFKESQTVTPGGVIADKGMVDQGTLVTPEIQSNAAELEAVVEKFESGASKAEVSNMVTNSVVNPAEDQAISASIEAAVPEEQIKMPTSIFGTIRQWFRRVADKVRSNERTEIAVNATPEDTTVVKLAPQQTRGATGRLKAKVVAVTTVLTILGGVGLASGAENAPHVKALADVATPASNSASLITAAHNLAAQAHTFVGAHPAGTAIGIGLLLFGGMLAHPKTRAKVKTALEAARDRIYGLQA